MRIESGAVPALVADALDKLAYRIERLSVSHVDPHAFYEARAGMVRELIDQADAIRGAGRLRSVSSDASSHR